MMPAAAAKLFALCFGICYICQSAAESAGDRLAGILPAQSRKPADTLVIYIYAEVQRAAHAVDPLSFLLKGLLTEILRRLTWRAGITCYSSYSTVCDPMMKHTILSRSKRTTLRW